MTPMQTVASYLFVAAGGTQTLPPPLFPVPTTYLVSKSSNILLLIMLASRSWYCILPRLFDQIFFWPLPFFLSTRDSISLSSSTAGVADVQTRKPAECGLCYTTSISTRLGILSCKRKAYLPTMGRPLGKYKSSADFGISDLSLLNNRATVQI